MTGSLDAQTVRDALNTYVPGGFRDDDGVWHETTRKADALAALERLVASVEALTEQEAEVRRQHDAVMIGIRQIGGLSDGHSGVYTEQDGAIREWDYRLARVVECPFCGFTMGAEHLDDKSGEPSYARSPSYTCPDCAESATEARVVALTAERKQELGGDRLEAVAVAEAIRCACGHDHDRSLTICPDTCAGCKRLLEHVGEGAADDCPVCLRFLDGCASGTPGQRTAQSVASVEVPGNAGPTLAAPATSDSPQAVAPMESLLDADDIAIIREEGTFNVPSDAARLLSLEEALRRLKPILQNAKDGFDSPPSYTDSSLNAWRFEGLVSGCRIGLEVIDRALAASVGDKQSEKQELGGSGAARAQEDQS